MSRVQSKRRWDDPDYLAYRARFLPIQIASAREKLRRLEDEARRYRMFDLIEGKAS